MVLFSLPIGVRFNPSEQELVGHYLRKRIERESNPKKGLNANEAILVPDVECSNKEPWDLPRGHVRAGDKEIFLFCELTPEGRGFSRTVLRSGKAVGFWKATGGEKAVKDVAGWKQTLVYYTGTSNGPNQKTDWVVYEYRLPSQKGTKARRTKTRVAWRVFLPDDPATTTTPNGLPPSNNEEATNEPKAERSFEGGPGPCDHVLPKVSLSLVGCAKDEPLIPDEQGTEEDKVPVPQEGAGGEVPETSEKPLRDVNVSKMRDPVLNEGSFSLSHPAPASSSALASPHQTDPVLEEGGDMDLEPSGSSGIVTSQVSHPEDHCARAGAGPRSAEGLEVASEGKGGEMDAEEGGRDLTLEDALGANETPEGCSTLTHPAPSSTFDITSPDQTGPLVGDVDFNEYLNGLFAQDDDDEAAREEANGGSPGSHDNQSSYHVSNPAPSSNPGQTTPLVGDEGFSKYLDDWISDDLRASSGSLLAAVAASECAWQGATQQDIDEALGELGADEAHEQGYTQKPCLSSGVIPVGAGVGTGSLSFVEIGEVTPATLVPWSTQTGGVETPNTRPGDSTSRLKDAAEGQLLREPIARGHSSARQRSLLTQRTGQNEALEGLGTRAQDSLSLGPPEKRQRHW